MRCRPLLVTYLLACGNTSAADFPNWTNAEVARLYAKAALIEWSSRYPVERSWLANDPIVLARSGDDGERVVQVIYEAGTGSYVVTLLVNRDNFLEVFGRGASAASPEDLSRRFNDPAFDPASLLQGG